MISLIVLICVLSNIYNSFATNVGRTVRLNNGKECPIIGLGTSRAKDEVVKQMVYDAIDAGYRHIDTAHLYGNEKPIGEALNQVIRSGKVKRENVFLTTKLFFKDYPENNVRQLTKQSVQLSLQRLNMNYVDLMLIHWPSNDSETNNEIWSGLEDALRQGLVKSIGVSNFNAEQLKTLLKSAKIIPAMNQVLSNPKNNQRELISYCKQFGIHITAYSPLGKGSLIPNPTIIEIGKHYNKSSAQVMIRWQIQRGVVVIPKSTKKERIKENIDVFDFSLTDDDMKTLENMENTEIVLTNSGNAHSIHFYLTLISIFILFK